MTETHDYIEQPGYPAPCCSRCKVVTWSASWEFVATWNPGSGDLPGPILRLFRDRSTIEPGRAVHLTDSGHANYYVQAVDNYLHQYAPHRLDDIAVVAVEVPCPADEEPA